MQALRKKFKRDETDDCSASELKKFLNLLLKSTVNYQQEVKITNGASSNLGKLILKLCKNYAKNINTDDGESIASEELESSVDDNDVYNSILRKPIKREYILRTSASRPAPYSRQSPQRMYCLLSSNEFRISGAWSEDTIFF